LNGKIKFGLKSFKGWTDFKEKFESNCFLLKYINYVKTKKK